MNKKFALIFLLLLGLPALAQAQIGKRVKLIAGTPEDRALAEATAATDPAKKVELLNKYVETFAGSDAALFGFEALLAHYAEAKDYARAYEYGEKMLALDPENFNAASVLMRLAQEQGNTAKMFDYGWRIGALLARYKASPMPEDVPSPQEWDRIKEKNLTEAAEQIQFVQYTLFSAAYQTPDPAARASLLEKFSGAFPDSPYASTAQQLVAAAYQQAQNYPKMLEFAGGVLARDANNTGMLLLLADYYSERGQELDKAEEYAKRALDLLGKAAKPDNLTDEQWAQQKSVQQGLAQSSLGQVYINKNLLPQAEAAFRAAGPLLKSDVNTYGRNQYRLGFTLARAKKTAEARTVLTEVVAMKCPYSPLAQETLDKLGAGPPKKRR